MVQIVYQDRLIFWIMYDLLSMIYLCIKNYTIVVQSSIAQGMERYINRETGGQAC